MAEPGWTMFMVSHFHYDPVWWNTQGAYTSEWTEDPPGRARQQNGFDLVHAHLEMARRDPEYKFVLAEVDYLNGEIALLGRLHGVPTPLNDLLQRLVTEYARDRRKPGELTPSRLRALLG